MSGQLFDFRRGLARVTGITAVDEIDAAGSQPVLVVVCFVANAARSARLNMALQIEEGAIGAVSDLAHVTLFYFDVQILSKGISRPS